MTKMNGYAGGENMIGPTAQQKQINKEQNGVNTIGPAEQQKQMNKEQNGDSENAIGPCRIIGNGD